MANQTLWGFHRLADLKARRVTEIGVDRVGTAISQSIEAHNRNLAQMRAVFAESTTQWKLRFNTPGASRMQRGDEDSRARKKKQAAYYEVGWPLYHWMDAWGGNFITLEKMTVQEAEDQTRNLLDANIRTQRDEMLIAIFDNVGYTFADQLYGDLPVKGLANGDSVTYNVLTGADVGATDSHFGASASALTIAQLEAIKADILEHPENGGVNGKVTVFVPSANKAAIEALTGFYEVLDANLRQGTSATVLAGSDGLSGPGELFGYAGGCFLREWRQLPTDYYVAVPVSGGAKPFRMREEPEANLRGFRKVAERNDYPFYEDQYFHRFGFGAWNRVGAYVHRAGNGTYAIPTGFTRGS